MASSIAPLFRTTEEQPTPVTATVTGCLPNWLEGRFLRVGPGVFDLEDFTVNHWFDGFSVLYKFDISNGKVTFIKKYLQSDAYKKALISKKPVFTEFGTKAYTDTTKSLFSRVISTVLPDLTDNCAINVFTFNNQVFVSSESAIIREINPKTLDTLDKVDLSKVGATLISSHFQTDRHGDLYTMATEIFTSAQYSVLKVPKSASNKNCFKKVESMCRLSPDNGRPSTYHSFGTTDDYLVFIEQPVKLNMLKVMSLEVKGRCLHDCMDWRPHLMNNFYVIHKKSGKVLSTKYKSTTPFFMCHFINCYEEDNQLVVDLVEYEGPELFDQMYLDVVRKDQFNIRGGGCARRFVLPIFEPGQELPEEGKNLVTLKTRATAVREGDIIQLTGHSLSDRGYEQPTINPEFRGRKYRYFYASSMIDCGPLRNSIVKVDMETEALSSWRESETSFPGEPHFVPRPGATAEEDGVLLVPVTNTSPAILDSLVVLDPSTLKEIARASIDCHLPNLMHGLFMPISH